MLNLEIPPDLVVKLERELIRARQREIGGVLVGEHRGRNSFRIVDLSVQRHGGDAACFVRQPAHHKRFLDAFFARTGDDYMRCNYLGEWHSHPSFSLDPSGTDCLQMLKIVTDGPDAPPFAVLLIVRLGADRRVMLSATAFHDDGTAASVRLRVQARPDGDPPVTDGGWLSRLFGPPTVNPVRRLI
ncbi:Mov34/MPN/PAD-1 family protein [uncultured Brevundimonas sp.]|uniref:Mov34/MPN/PAD-1 family protein n=1 Tax=uncultured Brevundimonas sp. TaxID=213418 RepID=UPI0030ECF7C8|tara:strand:+ start:1747 stop:2304 length:558 start_codon:yes stop_codon:yes gene_type:complete